MLPDSETQAPEGGDDLTGRTVSVVVPCFNTGRLLLDALDSITRQKGRFQLQEIIVVDDGSTDPVTLDVLSELHNHPGVRVLANNRRKGPAGARNTGAFAASGNWLAFLDGDDLWLPAGLAARFTALEMFPQAAFFAGDFQIWYADTGKIEDNFFATRDLPAQYYGPAYHNARPVLLPRPSRETLGTALCHSCSVLVARALFVEVGGYEESLIYKEDHHLWYKLSKAADLVLIPQSLFLYRQHANNMTRRECSPFEYERVMLDYICRTEDPVLYADDIAAHYLAGFEADARWHRGRREFAAAMRDCIAGLKRAPTSRPLWKQLLGALMRLH